MWRGISLANKCVLLFGMAVVLIILAALTVAFMRVRAIVEEGERELSRQTVQTWIQARGADLDASLNPDENAKPRAVEPGVSYPIGVVSRADGHAPDSAAPDPAATIRVILPEQIDAAGTTDPFVKSSWKQLSAGAMEVHEAEWTTSGRIYRFARLQATLPAVLPAKPAAGASGGDKPAQTATEPQTQPDPPSPSASSATLAPTPPSPPPSPRVSVPGTSGAMVVLERLDNNAIQESLVNLAYMFSAGLIALGLAVMVFYLITTRLILGPVRDLRETAERVREGDTSIRSDIHTGDEFEELGETFNQMLEAVTASQQQLRAINTSLDLKVNELAERNISLYEANKIKGEFLASVSHELRTPLNSIIGFAELLQEQVERDTKEQPESPTINKRRRYLDNIVTSGRNLLEMINGLLDMAKLEAGRMELKLEMVNLADLCEALVALIRPVAERAGGGLGGTSGAGGVVEVVLDVQPDLPLIETDAKKLQQVIFNLLSNAVKFTSEKYAASAGGSGGGRVTLRAERLFGRASEGAGAEDRVRISVLDTGPGIAPEDQEKLFEKFTQLDSGYTRKHAGTGLGLAICKELTGLLQGEIQVDSELGRGSMFSIILPVKIESAQVATTTATPALGASGVRTTE